MITMITLAQSWMKRNFQSDDASNTSQVVKKLSTKAKSKKIQSAWQPRCLDLASELLAFARCVRPACVKFARRTQSRPSSMDRMRSIMRWFSSASSRQSLFSSMYNRLYRVARASAAAERASAAAARVSASAACSWASRARCATARRACWLCKSKLRSRERDLRRAPVIAQNTGAGFEPDLFLRL